MVWKSRGTKTNSFYIELALYGNCVYSRPRHFRVYSSVRNFFKQKYDVAERILLVWASVSSRKIVIVRFYIDINYNLCFPILCEFGL